MEQRQPEFLLLVISAAIMTNPGGLEITWGVTSRGFRRESKVKPRGCAWPCSQRFCVALRVGNVIKSLSSRQSKPSQTEFETRLSTGRSGADLVRRRLINGECSNKCFTFSRIRGLSRRFSVDEKGASAGAQTSRHHLSSSFHAVLHEPPDV